MANSISAGQAVDVALLTDLQDYSTENDLSDIVTHESSTTGGRVVLVDVAGPGKLLGGSVGGYYPRSIEGTNYKVTITLDGNTFQYPSIGAYSTTSGGNSAEVKFPPIEFSSGLRIEYTVEGSKRVYGVAWTKQ